MGETVSAEMCDFILNNIKSKQTNKLDKPWWIGSTSREFTLKIAFQIVRHKRDKVEWAKFIWTSGLPHKISFFLWRDIKGRIPIDDNLKRCRIPIVSKYCCCSEGLEETMHHLFLSAPIAKKL